MDTRTMSARAARLATAGLLALAAAAVPLGVDLEPRAAFADKGGGKGNAGGGQGRGNGNSNGNDGAASNGADDDGQSTESASTSDLGRLNAAHASETAMANAAPNSAVGEVAAYRDAVLAGETEDAAVAVDAATNKTVTESVLHALNELLGIDDATVDPETGATVHDTEGEVAGLAGDE